MDIGTTTFGLLLLFGAVSAKWALELGFSQLSQIGHFIAGFFLGPLVLLILYVRLINQRKAQGLPGAQFFGSCQQAQGHEQ